MGHLLRYTFSNEQLAGGITRTSLMVNPFDSFTVHNCNFDASLARSVGDVKKRNSALALVVVDDDFGCIWLAMTVREREARH